MIAGITTALMIAAFLQALTFVLRYLMTDWFMHTMGRHAMAFMVALTLVLALGVSFQIWGDWIGRDIARLFSYSLINLVFGWRLWLLFSGQRRNRKTGPNDNHVS